MLALLPGELRDKAAQRYDRHGPLLLERLTRLYGTRDGFADWFAGLMESVARRLAARSVELRRLDAERAANPRWFLDQQMLGYCAYVDRFGGTLRGVADRIPHLRELGVTYLHLLPFLRARNGDSDGGFAVSSYDDVESRLGTISDLEQLAAQLRKAGISLCSDFVLNHVADDHAWAIGAAKGDTRLRDYFYVFPDRSAPDRFEQTLVQIFPEAAPGNFTWSEAMQGWVWTTFYPYQWDLNYSNPEVFAEMATALLRLANRGVEVFRLDSTAFLWKREGTDGMNQPEAHWILQALRCIVDIAAPGVLLKAEAIVPTGELPAYFGAADGVQECHLAYHSSLMAATWSAVAEQRAELLCKVIEGTPPLPEHASWLTYVRCHDDIGWKVLRPEVKQSGCDDRRLAAVSQFFSGSDPASFANGRTFQTNDAQAVHGTNGMASALVGYDRAQGPEALELAERRLTLLYGLAMAFGGLPLVYMGDEIALGNDMSEASLAASVTDSRWIQRPPLDAMRFGERYDTSTTAGRAFAAIRWLIQRRKRLPALAGDTSRRLLPTDHPALLALQRGDEFILLANFSSEPIPVDIERLTRHTGNGTWFDSLSERWITSALTLAPWDMVWLEHRQ
jgi:amylosucrase